MSRRLSSSQFRNKLRQAQNKQRQAINEYNRLVRQRNQKIRTAVNQYNAKVRTYNNRVRANHSRLRLELSKLKRFPIQSSHMSIKTSVETVNRAYLRLDAASETHHYGSQYHEILDLSEREAANSASVLNALTGNHESVNPEDIGTTKLDAILSNIDTDLSARWQGALFSLNPINPDAARHFCTSAREVLTRILERFSPDHEVFESLPNCETKWDGSPNRRSRIEFLLLRSNNDKVPLVDFVEEDINDVLKLFQTFNDGTHGSAGRFSIDQLTMIKTRVEHAIEFLWRVIDSDFRSEASR